LFIHRTLPSIDYIDVASELTRFVYKKPVDVIVHSISDKLSSPIETLKRRGIPVDRLLKIAEQKSNHLRVRPTTTTTSCHIAMKFSFPVESAVGEPRTKQVDDQQQQQQQQRGFLRSLKE
jgi:hypothetical protein